MNLSIADKSKKQTFLALFQLLKSCSSIIKIHFNVDHLYIQGMDKAHVCLFEIKIDGEWFNAYSMTHNTIMDVCVDSTMFVNILSMAQEHHTIQIEHVAAGEEELNINLVNNQNVKGEYNTYFTIPLADVDMDILNIPDDIDYDAEFSINAKKMHEITSQLSLFGDTMNIQCSEEKMDICASGVLGKMVVNVPIDDLDEFSISEGDEIDLHYSINYVHKMCMTTKLSADISISISDKFPMKIKYDLGNNSFVTFYIAPKIND